MRFSTTLLYSLDFCLMVPNVGTITTLNDGKDYLKIYQIVNTTDL